ncbi:hypothetical protein [Cellulomonas fimi]|uniref:Uncharacterized protein n=1 Tax=Cellulomonas fimi TaxID=1708 RepID=A0A7Y0LYK5_CELFI|nr:hypothetical protein [Cellulomonas fimi]NMR20286.1 hypothetical protein [Cellulomonas fimi]
MSSEQERIDALEARVVELEDRLHTLALSVHYREDEPYFAEISRLMLSSADRVVLNLVLSGILERASGSAALRRPSPERLSHPALDETYVDAPIDHREAVRLVALVVGGEEAARRLLEAHRRQGLGEAGHQALGPLPA